MTYFDFIARWRNRSAGNDWFDWLPAAAIGAWLLVMIALPILEWTGFQATRPMVVSLSVALQATAVALILRGSWDGRRIALAFAATAAFTLLVEAAGTRTGLIFGAYTYTDTLWPQLLHVPLLIPVAWFMMLLPAWAVAYRWMAQPLRFAAVAATALTAWDLFLDPQMVEWGFWVWHDGGAYFGIPLRNFAGWWGTGFVLSLGLHRLLAGRRRPHLTHNTRGWLLFIYTLTAVLETIGLAVFWSMPGPAAFGAVAMGTLVWLGWRAWLEERATEG